MKRTIALFLATSMLLLTSCTPADNSSSSSLPDNEINSGSEPPPPYIKPEYMETYTKYISPLCITGQLTRTSWNSAKDIDPNELVRFCAWNNLTNNETVPPNTAPSKRGEYINHYVVKDKVEKAVQEYFDFEISSEYLQGSMFYEDRGDDDNLLPIEEVKDKYLLVDGFGGGSAAHILTTITDEDMLYIYLAIYSDVTGPYELDSIGVLKVKLLENSFKYVSYQLYE